MMKLIKVGVLVGIFMVVGAGASFGVEEAPYEIGLILGKPTGISFKMWKSFDRAIDLAGAWDLDQSLFRFHGDYLWHRAAKEVVKTPAQNLIYYGIGVRFIAAPKEGEIGLRLVAGLEHFFEDSPLTFFMEIAPVMLFMPSTEFDVDYGVGLRYSFF